MVKKIFISILLSLVFLSFSYSQSKYKDPFESLLPQEVKEEEAEEESHEEIISEIEVSLPPMVIQGILWGGDSGQVIIDGEVYRVGDRLKNIDAQVFRIEKDVVFIAYEEKIYRVKIGKKGEL